MKLPMMLLAAVAAVPTLAADFEEAPTPLDPLVVTATRSEQWQSDIVASVDVISRAEIERAQANDLADLLRGVVGVDTARNGGPGSPASVFIRGLESNHTLFLVDGVRYTTESFLNAQIQNLAPEMIERIEIVKGPRSGLWGSDAMGGVIQIITRRPPTGLAGEASISGGSYGARGASGFLGYRDERSELALGLQRQVFGGFPPLHDGTEDRGHQNLNANLRAERSLGAMRIGVRHLEATGTNEYVYGAPRSQDFTNRVSAIEVGQSLARWDTRGTLSVASDDLLQREPSDPARPNHFDATQVRRQALEWENRFTLSDLTLVAGLAGSRSDIDSVFYSGFGDSRVRDHSSQYAAFGRATRDFGAIDAAVAMRHAHHDQFGGFSTGDFALGWHLGATRLGLTAGSAYKEPELTDLYGDIGNPDLEPERSASIELNLRQGLGERQVLTVAAFQTIASNLITFPCVENCDDGDFFNDVYQGRNVERARIRGLEAGWRYFGGGWSAQLSGSMQNPVNETTGAILPRRSRRSAQAALGRDFGLLRLDLDAVAHGPRRDSEYNDAVLAGHTLVGAGVSGSLADGWRLSLRGENLLDADYELASGFRTAGRSGSIELRASF